MMNFKNKSPKFLISGYYGYDNFGDEAILRAIVSEIRNKFPNSAISVISNSPERTKKLHQCESVHKYDVFGILAGLLGCDVFISGGGSLFQDVTSFKSLCYYLAVLYTAQLLHKKTFIYAQGIGPLKSRTARFLTSSVFKKVSLITLRDRNSAEILSGMGINSTVTADPVWALEYKPARKVREGLKIGIQLRKWNSLDEQRLNIIAEVIISNFKNTDAEILLISLQQPGDIGVLGSLRDILVQRGFTRQIKLLSCLSIEEVIDYIASFDYMIAMRYHAGLVAAKYCVPSLVLSYDPKVTTFARQTSFPCVSVEDVTFENLDSAIKQLVYKKQEIKEILEEVSAKNPEKARENITYLTTMTG